MQPRCSVALRSTDNQRLWLKHGFLYTVILLFLAFQNVLLLLLCKYNFHYYCIMQPLLLLLKGSKHLWIRYANCNILIPVFYNCGTKNHANDHIRIFKCNLNTVRLNRVSWKKKTTTTTVNCLQSLEWLKTFLGRRVSKKVDEIKFWYNFRGI